MKNPSPEWAASVDWRRSDRAIAAEVGLSRQYVHTVRKSLGARAPLGQPTLRDQVAQLPVEELTAQEIAERVGAHRASIVKVCQDLGRKPKPKPRRDRPPLRVRLEAIDTASLTVPEIAAILGDVRVQHLYTLLARLKIPYKPLAPNHHKRRG